MEFVFEVRATVERVSGKFASREDVAAELMQTLESTDPGTVYGLGADGDSSYEVQSWDVEEQPQPRRKRQTR